MPRGRGKLVLTTTFVCKRCQKKKGPFRGTLTTATYNSLMWHVNRCYRRSVNPEDVNRYFTERERIVRTS